MFSHDVTAVMLVSQNNEMAAMLMSQTNPLGVGLFSYIKQLLLFQETCIDAGHVSENTLYALMKLFGLLHAHIITPLQ